MLENDFGFFLYLLVRVSLEADLSQLGIDMAVAEHLQQRHVYASVAVLELAAQIFVAFVGLLVITFDEAEIPQLPCLYLRF